MMEDYLQIPHFRFDALYKKIACTYQINGRAIKYLRMITKKHKNSFVRLQKWGDAEAMLALAMMYYEGGRAAGYPRDREEAGINRRRAS